MTRTTALVLAGALHLCASYPVSAQTARVTDRVEQALRALPIADVPLSVVDAAGLTASGRRLWSLEPTTAPAASKRKVVIVGGLDGSPESTAAVMRVLHWWFTHRDAAVLRNDWELAAVPCARPGHCDADTTEALPAPLTFPPAGGFFDGKLEPTPHYVWRWTTMQAPTIAVEIREGWPLKWEANALATTLVDAPTHAGAGSLVAALGAGGHGAAASAPVPAVRLTARTSAAAEAVRDLLRASTGAVSPLRTASLGRASRSPLDVARLLAPKYPAQPIMSYIPALSWSGSLHLARMTGEPGYRTKPIAEMLPFLKGETPALVEPYVLTSLAGVLAFADWAAIDDNTEAGALAQNAADLILPQAPAEVVRFARGWTDDMFMATSVLARVAARTKEDRYGEAVGRLLAAYAADLQRPDGLFIHAKDGPHAWGSGNGFAAIGLMEALTHLLAPWPDRPRVLQSYQALMKGLLAQQAADGMWRQVVDEPGSYREFTVTAMMVTAMARGLRLGWIDASYRPPLERAWRGLLARIAEDGTLVDVCTGTGSGPTKEYYLNRAGLTGPDDRGGAMGLTAALEMEELARSTVRK
jgi:unsaturated rhamnogalacturonyl hydrolase